MSLELLNLKKSYREPDGSELPVLDLAEYRLQSAEQAVLVGDSGGGKTTLLNVIAGITEADSGKIVVDGYDITRLPEPSRDRFRARNIGIVFQTFNLLAGFSALENVLLGMTFSGKTDRKFARDLLTQVGLDHRLHHRPSQLSVGEQQRVAVARALASRPRLMLADEPTANVDRRNQQNILDLIRAACQESKVALLLVTHSAEVAAQFTRVDRLSDFNRVAKSTASHVATTASL